MTTAKKMAASARCVLPMGPSLFIFFFFLPCWFLMTKTKISGHFLRLRRAYYKTEDENIPGNQRRRQAGSVSAGSASHAILLVDPAERTKLSFNISLPVLQHGWNINVSVQRRAHSMADSFFPEHKILPGGKLRGVVNTPSFFGGFCADVLTLRSWRCCHRCRSQCGQREGGGNQGKCTQGC